MRKLFYLMFLVVLLGLTSAAPAAIHWSDGDPADHLWSTPGNWLEGNPPTSAQSACISAGLCNIDSTMTGVNKAVCNVIGDIGSTGAATLNVNGGELDITTSGVYMAVGQIGTLNVTNGGKISCGSGDRFRVGWTGDATLYVNNGTITTEMLVLGSQDGSTGQVTIDSGNITTTGEIRIGASGNGTVNLHGGTLTSSDGHVRIGYGSGVGTVNMTGGTLSATGGELKFIYIGVNGGTDATLTMSGGTVSTTGSGDSSGRCYIGSAGSNGTATVNGGNFSISGILRLGNDSGSTGTLNITAGGNVAANKLFIGTNAGATGDVNMTGGTVNVTYQVSLGTYGAADGYLHMTGGNLTSGGTLYVGEDAAALPCCVDLDGGTINATNLFIRSNSGFDIEAGTLVLAGDDRTTVNGYINDGLLTGYGSPRNVKVYYDGYTTMVTADANLVYHAWNPCPDDGLTDVDPSTNLTWTPGLGATSHDVYFGTNFDDANDASRQAGDVDGDGDVDLLDVWWLAEQWLTDPLSCSQPSADLNGDDIVDIVDFAILADDWMEQADAVFIGNQDANSYDPDLEFSQTYYWRIDEVNEADTYKGDIWSFATKSAYASNPYPADGSALYPGGELSWKPGVFATSHDVYFGTDGNAVADANHNYDEFVHNQPGTSYDPGTLDANETYYWRIDEVDDSHTYTGDVWSFFIGVDNSTLIGKVMCGYQMWFGTPENPNTGGTFNFTHYRNGPEFYPGNCCIDCWPDMSEMDPDEKYATVFEHADSSTAYVFNSCHPKTVDRHFQWMRDYGISGVFVQRFGVLWYPEGLLLCRDIAPKYGRVFAQMYDLSWATLADLPDVEEDFKMLVDTYGILDSPAYMHHNGAPVVAIWGIGFDREYDDGIADLIDFFKNDPNYGGNTVMLGLNSNWLDQADIRAHVLNADIASPWAPGRYHNISEVQSWAVTHWQPEQDWCTANNREYMPVVFPGFSWHNMFPEAEFDAIPRLGGQFLWQQFYETINVGVTMIYQAMFDEMDEGTAIFKCTNDPPVGLSPFLPTGNAAHPPKYPEDALLPSDHYLWLVGQGQRMLDGEIALTETLPTR